MRTYTRPVALVRISVVVVMVVAGLVVLYGLILDRDSETGASLVAEKRYSYRLEQGPTAATGDDPQTLQGSTLLALNGEGTLDELGLREARELTRRALSRYLGDKPLKSRELFRSVSKRQ